MTKLVGMMFARRTNGHGIAWPGNAGLADDCSIKPRAVQNHLQALVEVGALERVNSGRPRAGAGRPAAEYRLLLTDWRPISGTAVPVIETEDAAAITGTAVPETPNYRHGGTELPAPGCRATDHRTDHYAVVVSVDPLEGDGDDDQTDDSRAEFVFQAIEAADSLEELAAIRAADPWAFAPPWDFVSEAHKNRLEHLELPQWLR